MSSRTFSLLGTEVVIPEDRDRYNSARKTFIDMAEKYTQEFVTRYDEEIGSLSVLLDKVDKIAYSVFGKAADEVALMLMNNNVYTFDGKRLVNEYMDTDMYDDKVAELQYMYDAIEGREADLDQMRKARRRSHQCYVGGGIGISGALKGSAKAGAMNMAAGAFQGARNLIAKGLSSIGAYNDKKKIFNDPSTLSDLKKGVFDAVSGLIDPYIDIVEKECGITLKYVSTDESDQCQSICSNLSRIAWNDNTVPVVKKAIELNPYNNDIYYLLLLNTNDHSAEIKQLVVYFNLDYDYIAGRALTTWFGSECTDPEIPETIESAYRGRIDKDCKAREEEIKSLREKLIATMAEYGLCKSSIKEKIDKALENIDESARTYKEIAYSSREERDLAEKQDQELDQYIKACHRSGKGNLISLRHAVVEKNYLPDIAKPYLYSIDKEISKEIINELPELCSRSSTIEEAQNVLDSIEAVRSEVENTELGDKTKENCIKQINDKAEKAREIFDYINKRDLSNRLAKLGLDIDSTDIKVLNRVKDEINKSAADKEMREKYISVAEYQYTLCCCRGIGLLSQEKGTEMINDLVGKGVSKKVVLSIVRHLIASDLREVVEKELRTSDLRNKSGWLFREDISEKQMCGIVEKLAKGVNPDDVILLIDDSTYSNGKTGVVLTVDTAYISYLLGDHYEIRYENVESAKKTWSNAEITLIDKTEIVISDGGNNVQSLMAEMLPVLASTFKLLKDCAPELFMSKPAPAPVEEILLSISTENGNNYTATSGASSGSAATAVTMSVFGGLTGTIRNFTKKMNESVEKETSVSDQTTDSSSAPKEVQSPVPPTKVDLRKNTKSTSSTDPETEIMNILKQYIGPLGKNSYKFYINPDLPVKKVNAALSTFAKSMNSGKILAMLDTTLFGTGKKGAVFTNDMMFLARTFETPISTRYDFISELRHSAESNNIAGGLVTFVFKDGTTADIREPELNPETLIEIITRICSVLGVSVNVI